MTHVTGYADADAHTGPTEGVSVLELPIWVHRTWRPMFEHRWRRARPLLLLGFGIAPVVIAGAGVGVAVAYGSFEATAFPAAVYLILGAVLLFAPIGYLWWFLFGRRLATRTDFWGTRVGVHGCVQSWGVGLWLQAAPGAPGNGVLLGIPAAVFGLGVLGGVACWRAHAVMLDDTGGALAATSMRMEQPAAARVDPIGYLGDVYLDGTRMTWSLHRGGGQATLVTFDDGVALNEILDARIVPITDPTAVPPLGYLVDGRPVRPEQGELLVVRTPWREVGVPTTRPRQLQQSLNVRLTAIRT